jgi:hypothetical protein
VVVEVLVLTQLHVLVELLPAIQMGLILHLQRHALLLQALQEQELLHGHVILRLIVQIFTILQEHVLLPLPLPHAVKMTMRDIVQILTQMVMEIITNINTIRVPCQVVQPGILVGLFVDQSLILAAPHCQLPLFFYLMDPVLPVKLITQ